MKEKRGILMSIKMSKMKAVLFAITACITSFTVMWQMSEIVIVNDLYIAFPGSESMITVILSWPALLTALSSLLAGSLLKKISTKMELIIAGVLMLFGIAAPWANNIIWLIVCSFLMAIGAGFSNTAGMSIISEVFIDEKKRASQMGYYNAVMSLLGVAITFLAGIFALQGWQAAFRVNWFAVPMLIMTIVFLPNIKPEDRVQEAEYEAGEETATLAEGKGFGSRFWIYFISMFIFFIAYSCFFTYISLYVGQNELGDSAFTGTCSSLTTVGSFCAALSFGFFYSKMHRKYSIMCIILPMLGYAWAWLAPSKIALLIISTVYGFCYGGIFTMIYVFASELVSPSKNGLAMGIMTFNYSIAITIGTYLFSFLMGSSGLITPTYPFAMGILAVALIIEVICSIGKRKAPADAAV